MNTTDFLSGRLEWGPAFPRAHTDLSYLIATAFQVPTLSIHTQLAPTYREPCQNPVPYPLGPVPTAPTTEPPAASEPAAGFDAAFDDLPADTAAAAAAANPFGDEDLDADPFGAPAAASVAAPAPSQPGAGFDEAFDLSDDPAAQDDGSAGFGDANPFGDAHEASGVDIAAAPRFADDDRALFGVSPGTAPAAPPVTPASGPVPASLDFPPLATTAADSDAENPFSDAAVGDVDMIAGGPAVQADAGFGAFPAAFDAAEDLDGPGLPLSSGVETFGRMDEDPFAATPAPPFPGHLGSDPRASLDAAAASAEPFFPAFGDDAGSISAAGLREEDAGPFGAFAGGAAAGFVMAEPETEVRLRSPWLCRENGMQRFGVCMNEWIVLWFSMSMVRLYTRMRISHRSSTVFCLETWNTS